MAQQKMQTDLEILCFNTTRVSLQSTVRQRISAKASQACNLTAVRWLRIGRCVMPYTVRYSNTPWRQIMVQRWHSFVATANAPHDVTACALFQSNDVDTADQVLRVAWACTRRRNLYRKLQLYDRWLIVQLSVRPACYSPRAEANEWLWSMNDATVGRCAQETTESPHFAGMFFLWLFHVLWLCRKSPNIKSSAQ